MPAMISVIGLREHLVTSDGIPMPRERWPGGLGDDSTPAGPGGHLTFHELVKPLREMGVGIVAHRNGVEVAADRFNSRMRTAPGKGIPSMPETAGLS